MTAALGAATQVQGCADPLDDETTAHEWMLEVSPDAQAPVVAALREDPSVLEIRTDDAFGFSLSVSRAGSADPLEVVYVFSGETWIITLDGIQGGDFTEGTVEDLLQPLKNLNANAIFQINSSNNDWATPDASTGACGLSAVEVLGQYGSELEPYVDGDDESAWSLKDEFTLSEAAKTYDPCAELSSMTVTIEHGTISTPAHVILFHHDEYLGTATENPVIYSPTAERLADDSIEVTFMWPLEGEGEGYADASGKGVAVFTWDEASQSIVHTGDLPPE
ncbi:LppP/LprE family lipoprotein [Gulosibacter sp. ACHW.36C]|uniref:LppP/LprE family lipoprotein n=1 Tax=Gulosibacter sediminis TaxID=1729695 RepID=A0ABY4MXE9_9MICO|nr:LppP/LprE family lipoprotein [Gulosibacter sediminis]UQN15107.1 LppP/LprE family lipoprotein [Gulosibacter sediminis]